MVSESLTLTFNLTFNLLTGYSIITGYSLLAFGLVKSFFWDGVCRS